MTKLTFTKDDPPPPESLPDARCARARAARRTNGGRGRHGVD